MCLLHYSTDSISCGNEIRTLSISVFHPLQASWNNSVTTWAKLMKFAYILHVKRTYMKWFSVHVNVFGTLDTVLPTLADVSAVYNIYKRVQTTTGAFEESKKFKLVNRLPFPLVFSLKLC